LEHHEIRVLPDEFTAFRVREGNRNMSAVRRDSTLRGVFELFEILKRYRGFAPAFLREIFAADIARLALDTSGVTGVWLAEIALTAQGAMHPLFALDTLFEAAATPQAFDRLREVSGDVDAFHVVDPLH